MRSYAAFGIGVVAVLSLIGATLAEMASLQQADVDQANQAAAGVAEAAPPLEDKADALPDPEAVPAAGSDRVRDYHRRARGLYVRTDGTVVGRVNYIDPNTLRLIPAPNALVTFMQQRRVVAQGITGQDGMFSVNGLSPWAVYSLFVSSDDWVMMIATVTRPYDHGDDHWSRDLRPERSEDAPSGEASNGHVERVRVNEIRLVTTNMSLLQEGTVAADDALSDEADGGENTDANGNRDDETNEDDDLDRDDYMDYEFLELQVLPREDFISALRQGLLGIENLGPGGYVPGGAGGGAGGAGGAGGLGGAGLGLIGAGLGAAAIHAGDDDGELASPFTP